MKWKLSIDDNHGTRNRNTEMQTVNQYLSLIVPKIRQTVECSVDKSYDAGVKLVRMELENSQEIENYSRGLFGNHIEHISYILNESIIDTLKYLSIG